MNSFAITAGVAIAILCISAPHVLFTGSVGSEKDSLFYFLEQTMMLIFRCFYEVLKQKCVNRISIIILLQTTQKSSKK